MKCAYASFCSRLDIDDLNRGVVPGKLPFKLSREPG